MKLKGKAMLRKAKLADGNEALIVCGIFLASKESLDSVSDADEMWIVDLEITSQMIFYNPIAPFSPEEFLEGVPQKTSFWKNRKFTA